MRFMIESIDVSPYIKESNILRGYVSRNTRTRVTIEGKKYQSQIQKLSLTIPFEPLPDEDLQKLLPLFEQDQVKVLYKDPVLGLIVKEFIPSVGEISLVLEDRDGVSYWSGLSLGLEEQ